MSGIKVNAFLNGTKRRHTIISAGQAKAFRRSERGRMRKVFSVIRKDLSDVLPAFIFFLVMFHVVMVTRSLMLEEYGITTRASFVAVIGALVVAKVIFIADKFPFLNLYPRRPLLWNVLLKVAAFSLFVFLFQFGEEMFRQSHKHGGFSKAYEYLAKDMAWPVFWSSEIWVMVLLLFYCAAVELIRAIGTARAKEIFFGGPK